MADDDEAILTREPPNEPGTSGHGRGEGPPRLTMCRAQQQFRCLAALVMHPCAVPRGSVLGADSRRQSVEAMTSVRTRQTSVADQLSYELVIGLTDSLRSPDVRRHPACKCDITGVTAAHGRPEPHLRFR